MANITVRQLRYFEALALHGHFGMAAEASAVSQPALSMQIRDLELSLGVPLFERGPKRVRLTSFGEAFAKRAREILRGIDELGDMARVARDRLAGRLRLGIIPTIAPYLLPKVIRRLNAAYEGLDVHVRETITPRLIEELTHSRLDAAIVALPVSEPHLEEVSLFSEEFVLVRMSRDRDRPMPSADDLREMKLLLLEEGHCFRDQALSFCNMNSNAPREGLDASTLATLVQMVGSGIGVTLIPKMAVEIETRSADVTVSSFDKPVPTRTVGMVWRKTSPLASHLHDIANVVKDAAA